MHPLDLVRRSGERRACAIRPRRQVAIMQQGESAVGEGGHVDFDGARPGDKAGLQG
jgi:hypothetical protein